MSALFGSPEQLGPRGAHDRGPRRGQPQSLYHSARRKLPGRTGRQTRRRDTGLRENPEALADALIYVPNRRSERALAFALHQTSGRQASLLPDIRASGRSRNRRSPTECRNGTCGTATYDRTRETHWCADAPGHGLFRRAGHRDARDLVPLSRAPNLPGYSIRQRFPATSTGRS